MAAPSASRPPASTTAFLAPRWWPTWIAVGLARLLILLPIPWVLSLGEALGRFGGRFVRRRRRVVLTNLKLCFPEGTRAERKALADAHFAALGRGVFETALAWFAPDRRLFPHFEVAGREHLEAARATGQGLLLLTGHFTTLEIGARIVCCDVGLPFHAMYRPYANGLMDHLMQGWRERRSGLEALPRDDLRRLVRALREGRAIWYAPDQALDRNLSVFAPFFGVPTSTLTATARLARLGRARVLPYVPERIEGGWRVTFLPMLEDFPGQDDVADAARVNAVLEAEIRRATPEYFWIHRRFKRRPRGQPSVYR